MISSAVFQITRVQKGTLCFDRFPVFLQFLLVFHGHFWFAIGFLGLSQSLLDAMTSTCAPRKRMQKWSHWLAVYFGVWITLDSNGSNMLIHFDIYCIYIYILYIYIYFWGVLWAYTVLVWAASPCSSPPGPGRSARISSRRDFLKLMVFFLQPEGSLTSTDQGIPQEVVRHQITPGAF